MSGETEQNVSGWTTDTLHTYFQRQLDDLKVLLDERFLAQEKSGQIAIHSQDEAVKAALASAKEAVTKAEIAIEKRFDAANQFRSQLSDQAHSFIPRSEHAAITERLMQDVQELKDRMNSFAGEARGSQLSKGNYYAALAGVGSILGIVILLANNVFQ